MTADAPETAARRVLSEDEAAAVRRGVPDPGIPLPTVALPTLALWVASAALWVGAAVAALAALDGDISRWWLVATVPAHALVTFTMFTVLHEATHHAGRAGPATDRQSITRASWPTRSELSGGPASVARYPTG